MKYIKEVDVKLSGNERPFLCKVSYLGITEWSGSRQTKIIFDYLGDEYVYEWDGSPAIGLATVKKNGKMFYNPYGKNNPPEAYQMEAIGRELSCILRGVSPSSTVEPVQGSVEEADIKLAVIDSLNEWRNSNEKQFVPAKAFKEISEMVYEKLRPFIAGSKHRPIVEEGKEEITFLEWIRSTPGIHVYWDKREKPYDIDGKPVTVQQLFQHYKSKNNVK